MMLNPGDKVRVKANPGRVGILRNEFDGPDHRRKVLVLFLDGEEEFLLLTSLEKVTLETPKPYESIKTGRFGKVDDLRASITYYRLSGKLANLIYSLNTTNTQFLPYQFKPVLQFLESPCNGILIADEVGLGKTIEAGLIWTELRARLDARRLLIISPAMLREKWKDELANRFGVDAEIVDAHGLLKKLEEVRDRPQLSFALIASMQGIRPPRGYDDDDIKIQELGASGKLARFLRDEEIEESLLDMVVFDEAHYLRNRETQINKLGRLIRPVVQNMVMLSATPIQLRSSDLFNLLNLIDEDAFPYEFSFEQSLEENSPIVFLRDQLLKAPVSREVFDAFIRSALNNREHGSNLQLEYLRDNVRDEDLVTQKGRSELADQLDRINPLTKVITRTLKRDVHEMRVVRKPSAIRAEMHECERDFYHQVTHKVRQYCERMDVSTGFMLTIPQRQMSSCMAAACRGWQEKIGFNPEAISEIAYELVGLESEEQSGKKEQAGMGALLEELVEIALSVGSFQKLKEHDSKYAKLLEYLHQYWRDNPGKKVVLFSFYRQTLRYLRERLGEAGISSIIVQGGMDKHEAIRSFKEPNGPRILLASEVASEGVDLQFSSLVINYDLPWNPMRIEQRIGRIDRIGQEAERILIWNFMYADTVDERVYDRLLERLDIFTRALGSIEEILGNQIANLTVELLTHNLTPTEEVERINQTSIAIENNNRQQEMLEVEASQLIAHGDFIQNKVKAAKELGRYIRGEDLLAYVRDYLLRTYPGTRLLESGKNPLEYVLELSTEAGVRFKEFIAEHRLQGRTQIFSSRPPALLFENRTGSSSRQVEKITQDHPLVRFVTEELRREGKGPSRIPVSATEMPASLLNQIEPGVFVFVIARWSISGARDIERLEYRAQRLDDSELMDEDNSEYLVNKVALEGRDWIGAANEIDTLKVADLFDDLLDELKGEFRNFRDAQERANLDRINNMIHTLERHRDSQRRRIIERIQFYRYEGNDKQKRMIPVEEGRLNKLTQRMDNRIAELRLKEQPIASDSFVCGGVIRLY